MPNLTLALTFTLEIDLVIRCQTIMCKSYTTISIRYAHTIIGNQNLQLYILNIKSKEKENKILRKRFGSSSSPT